MNAHPIFIVLLTAVSLHAENPAAEDPYVIAAPSAKTSPPPSPERNISICYETFSAPVALAVRIQREGKGGSELYARLSSGSEKDGVRQESFDIVRCRSGNKANLASITEEIYPTEFEGSSMPATVGIAVPSADSGDTPAPATNLSGGAPATDGPGVLPSPATPTSFDTRDVGKSLEVQATIGEDPSDPLVDLRFNPEHVSFVGREVWGQGVSTAEMPVFESQRTHTSMVVRKNHTTFMGTISRPPVSQADPDSANRVWFAFVTVKVVQP